MSHFRVDVARRLFSANEMSGPTTYPRSADTAFPSFTTDFTLGSPSPEQWQEQRQLVLHALEAMYEDLRFDTAIVPPACLPPAVPSGRFCQIEGREGDGVRAVVP